MGAARLCWTRFFLARDVQLGAKQLYDRTSPLRLPAMTDCFIYLLTEKASFASKADAPRKNWLKFPHNEVVKMMETMPSLGAQLDFYAGTLQHPRLAPWSLERGLVNVYRRTGSILMMPTAKMPNVWRPIWKIRKKTITAKPSALGADGFCSIRILSIGIHTLFMDYFYCQKSFEKSNVICPAFLQELSIVKFSQKNPAAWLRDFRICTE